MRFNGVFQFSNQSVIPFLYRADQQIDVFVEKWLLEAYGNFFQDFMKSCKFEPEAGYLPVVVNEVLQLNFFVILKQICIVSRSSVRPQRYSLH